MSRFERYLQLLGNKITVKDEDRQIYTKDYDIIRDYIIGIMKRDAAFRQMFKGTSLFGSYANNVRINYPDEFDVIFALSMPYSSFIDIEENENFPGYVKLHMTDMLNELENDGGYKDAYELLDDNLIDYNNGYLRRTNIRRWIAGVIETGLKQCGNRVMGHLGDCYTLEYTSRAVAHTIFAHCAARKISIDFIPGIVFGTPEWLQMRFDYTFQCDTWYAIPKKVKPHSYDGIYTFMICNPKIEHILILQKQNLKVVFRLIKSLRNKYDMKRFKSYFIMIAFLWEVHYNENSFWNNELQFLLIYMLDKIYEYFNDGNLPFFWNPDCNLLDNLSGEEIDDYTDTLRKVYNTLINYDREPNLSQNAVFKHFEVPN